MPCTLIAWIKAHGKTWIHKIQVEVARLEDKIKAKLPKKPIVPLGLPESPVVLPESPVVLPESPVVLPESPEVPSLPENRGSTFGNWTVSLDLKTHKYAADSGTLHREGMQSVTGFIKSLFPEFNASNALKIMGRKKRDTVYTNMSDDQILAYWKMKGEYASKMGTILHDYMDRYLKLAIEEGCYPEFPEFPPNQPFVVPEGFPAELGDPVGQVINPETLKRFIQTLIDRQLEPVATEVCLYDDAMHLAGTTDGIFRCKTTGELWCFDWKRMPKMLGAAPFSSWGRKGTPMENYKQSKKMEVTLQLNLYRTLIQREGKQFPQPMTHLCAVMIHPELRSGFKEVEFPIEEQLTAQLVQMLEQRRENQ